MARSSVSFFFDTRYDYDNAGRVAKLEHWRDDDPTPFTKYTYTYDSANRIFQQTTSFDTTIPAFSNVEYAQYNEEHYYDDAGQLVENYQSNEFRYEHFTYYDNGNRTYRTLGWDGSATDVGDYNRLASDTDYTYLYDKEGNLTAVYLKGSPNVLWETYQYDHRNRLVRFENMAGVITYAYDANDRLVSRTDSTGTQHYVNDGDQRAIEFRGNGTLAHRYTWGLGRDQLLTDEVFNATGALDKTYWVATDQLGNVRELLDNSEAVVEHRDYNSFGELETAFDILGNAISPGSLRSSAGYTGKFFDSATGLQYNNARWYDPRTGKFINEDPARDGSNWYRYAGNDPINFSDPTGLSPAGNPLNGLYSGLGNYGPSYSAKQLFGTLPSLSGSSRSTRGTLVDLAFPVGPVNTASQPLTVSQKFSAYANSLGNAAIARSQAETAAFLNYRPAPSRGIALDRFVDDAFAAAGNLSRYSGDTLGRGIEYITSGYGGTFGNTLAGVGGGLAHLARTGGNIGAAVDLPRTFQGTVADVNEGIRIGREHGVTLGVGHFLGTNQIGQYIAGNDFQGQSVDVNTLADGLGRLSGTVLSGTGLASRVGSFSLDVGAGVEFNGFRLSTTNNPARDRFGGIRLSANPAVAEAVDTGVIRVTNARGAGVVSPDRHHIFPQEQRVFFTDRGIDIDRYRIPVDSGTHSALHYGPGGGWWNQEIMLRIQDIETGAGRLATPREILNVGAKLRRDANLQSVKLLPVAR